MDRERLQNQLVFLTEVDQMKSVLRQNLIADGSRRENDAEHSWHLAMLALVLEEYATQPVNVGRVLKMALVHDLVEVYAGDTFAYDPEANLGKESREQDAAEKLFGLLPPEQGAELRALWEEFDAMETPDSRYAAAMDRLQPFLLNCLTQGHTWKVGNVTSAQVYQRMDMVRQATPDLWDFVVFMVDDSIEKGYLRQ